MALYIYRVERSCPTRKYFYKSKSIRTPCFISDWEVPVRPVRHTGQTGLPEVQNLQKPYLSHTDSELDVPHIYLDLLDEIYLMVKSKLSFEHLDHTGLTGWGYRSDRSAQTCQIRVRTASIQNTFTFSRVASLL